MMARLGNPQKVFELIGMAKVSGSAFEAQTMGLLHKADRITMNPERIIGDAKALALIDGVDVGATCTADRHPGGRRAGFRRDETRGVDNASRWFYQRL